MRNCRFSTYVNSGILLLFVLRFGDLFVKLVLKCSFSGIVDAFVMRQVVIAQEVVDYVCQSFVCRKGSLSITSTVTRFSWI